MLKYSVFSEVFLHKANHILNPSLALRIGFPTDKEVKFSFIAVSLELTCQYQITSILTHNEQGILIIDKFIGNATIILKYMLMRLNYIFCGKWSVQPFHIFISEIVRAHV